MPTRPFYFNPLSGGSAGSGGLTAAEQMRGERSGGFGAVIPGGVIQQIAINNANWDLTLGNYFLIMGHALIRNAGAAGQFTVQFSVLRFDGVINVLGLAFDNILTIPAGDKITIPLYFNFLTSGNVLNPTDRMGVQFFNSGVSPGPLNLDVLFFTTSEYIV